MSISNRQFSTIGCCGIDCGLCPRFHTKGCSACPGCGGYNFSDKHPSCGFLTCCVAKKGKEVCSECLDFPCQRFEAEKQGYDSFVTHKKVFDNLHFIQNKGIETFVEQQKIRIAILYDLLENVDDGRSKIFFCLGCALFPLHELQEAWKTIKKLEIKDGKEKNRQVKLRLQTTANQNWIMLKLKNKKYG